MARNSNSSLQTPLTSIFSFVLLAFTLYFFVSLVTFNANDLVLASTASENLVIENYGGLIGAHLSNFLFSLLGASSYLLVILMVHEIVNILFFPKRFQSNKSLRITSSLVLLVMSCLFFEHILSGDNYPQLSAGGIIGYFGLDILSRYLGVYGALIFIVVFGLASLSFALAFSWISLISVIFNVN